MSATGAPSKALKVRPPAAKHYQLRHSCPLPNSLVLIATSRSSLQLIIYPGRGLETGAGRLLIMGSKSTRENSSIKIQKILMIVNSWSQIKPKMSNSQSRWHQDSAVELIFNIISLTLCECESCYCSLAKELNYGPWPSNSWLLIINGFSTDMQNLPMQDTL